MNSLLQHTNPFQAPHTDLEDFSGIRLWVGALWFLRTHCANSYVILFSTLPLSKFISLWKNKNRLLIFMWILNKSSPMLNSVLIITGIIYCSISNKKTVLKNINKPIISLLCQSNWQNSVLNNAAIKV